MNVAERLMKISGLSGTTAGAMLKQAGQQGTTAAQRLVAYSGLPTAMAWVHLLVDRGGYILFARRRGRR